MLEFLQARIHLARANICKPFDPQLANDHMVNSYTEAFYVGNQNHAIEPGALALNEPSILESFHEGAGNAIWWEHQVSLDYKEVDYL